MANEETPGGRAVRRWVEADPDRSYKGLAEALGVTTQSLYEWRFGASRPDSRNRELLLAATGIEPDIWATADERRAAREHERRMAALRGTRAS